jgi:hypothetical protein
MDVAVEPTHVYVILFSPFNCYVHFIFPLILVLVFCFFFQAIRKLVAGSSLYCQGTKSPHQTSSRSIVDFAKPSH